MTAQMKSLQDALPPASAAKLVTLTTDPDFDTPPVMNKSASVSTRTSAAGHF